MASTVVAAEVTSGWSRLLGGFRLLTSAAGWMHLRDNDRDPVAGEFQRDRRALPPVLLPTTLWADPVRTKARAIRFRLTLRVPRRKRKAGHARQLFRRASRSCSCWVTTNARCFARSTFNGLVESLQRPEVKHRRRVRSRQRQHRSAGNARAGVGEKANLPETLRPRRSRGWLAFLNRRRRRRSADREGSRLSLRLRLRHPAVRASQRLGDSHAGRHRCRNICLA